VTITLDEEFQNKMKTIYLDMDDVVADFKAYAISLLRKKSEDERWESTEWTKLKHNPRLYRDLNKTPAADVLVDACRTLCKQHQWQLKFLTAVPRNNDVHWAFYDKVIWAQQHFPDIPVMFGPYSKDKQVHCQPGDILIDDRTINCEDWRAAGGIAIQHTGDVEHTLKLLQDHSNL
jgi:5'(3')-deoxyribonucleotidase